MIRLTSLKVNNFKQLREVELNFPERFCALVEGLNEAGKSTLLESIYFGLYGKGLATGGNLSGLITHGNQNAEVTLGVVVHDVQLSINRKLYLTKPSKAKVEIIRPDRSETITGVTNTNKEVLAYLNNLDDESLLASCFVQQKNLGGLEELGVAARQKILLRLLDMDRLSNMGGAFKWGIAEKQKLDTARKKFRLTQITGEIAEATAELKQIERLYAMAKIHAALEAAECLNTKAQSARNTSAAHAAESLRLKEILSRIEALDNIINILGQVLRSREAITAREQDLAKVLNSICDIDRLEQETLPALQAELKDIGYLRNRIEQIASLEKERDEVNDRLERLCGATKKWDDLAHPRSELEAFKAQKEIAISEKNRLGILYEAVLRVENLRDTIARTNAEILQTEQRKHRLISAIETGKSLTRRQDQARTLRQSLKTLNEEIARQQIKVETAKSIQSKQAEIEALEKSLAASVEREISLRSLFDQANKLKARRQEVVQIEHLLDYARAELQQHEAKYLQAQQVSALQQWAAAKKDEDIRSKQRHRNTELKSKAEQARTRQQQSLRAEQAASRLILIGVGLAGAGIIISAIAAFSMLALIALGIVLIIAGVSIASIALKRRKQATADRQAREKEAAQFERGVLEGEAELRARLNQSPLDFQEAKRQLLALGLDEPASTDEAESKARQFGLNSVATLFSNVESKRQEVQAVEVDFKGKQGALEAEGQVLTRELKRFRLDSIDEVVQAISSAQEEQRRNKQLQAITNEEINKLNATLSSKWVMEGLAADLELCKDKQKKTDLDLAQIQGIIESEEKQIREVLEAENISDPDSATILIGEIEATLAAMSRKNEADKIEITLAESSISDNLNSAELYRKLDAANDEVRRIEGEITGTQARINSEEEAIADILQNERLADMDGARAVINDLQSEGLNLSRRIADAWKAEATLLQRWNIPAVTMEALNVITGEWSRISTEINRTSEHIGKRAALEDEKDRVKREIDAQLHNVAMWHEQISDAAQIAQLSADSQKLNCQTESELLNQTQKKRQSYDLVQVKTQQQNALQAQATEEAIAVQAENEAQECIKTAKGLLAHLGITNIQVPTPGVIAERLPEFHQVASADITMLMEKAEATRRHIHALDHEANQVEQETLVKREQLDFEECQETLKGLERKQVVCDRAGIILSKVQDNILKAVLPSTLDYMCRLLPYLTNGRYHEAQLNEESYKIHIWDGRAGDYLKKDVFSGATQDQFSLALRLAFALATLPEGLGARPKFIFLDEPTAGFDGERRKAFVELLTRGEVAQQFDQIFLLSPQGIFETNPLPHHIRIANGRVASESFSSASV